MLALPHRYRIPQREWVHVRVDQGIDGAIRAGGSGAVVLDRIEELWRAAGAEIERTRIGNVIARAGGQGPRLLLGGARGRAVLPRARDRSGRLPLARERAGLGAQDRACATGSRSGSACGCWRAGPIPGVIAAATGHLATLALRGAGRVDLERFLGRYRA